MKRIFSFKNVWGQAISQGTTEKYWRGEWVKAQWKGPNMPRWLLYSPVHFRKEAKLTITYHSPVMSGIVLDMSLEAATPCTCLLLALLPQFKSWLTTNWALLGLDIEYVLWARHCTRHSISISPFNLCTSLWSLGRITIPLQQVGKQRLSDFP